MSAREPDSVDGAVPEAVVKTGRSISIVWLIPVVAAVIGAWLAYRAISQEGPTIAIRFKSAEGLEAGKTKVKFKDVEVGQVVDVQLSEDLSQVVVSAKLDKGMEPHLKADTRFWVVRPRVAGGSVSGLGTLFSGAYVGMDPGKEGKRARTFQGLEVPPVVTTDLPGRHFNLRAQTRGSVEVGSPVYFRKIQVGQVVAYQLDEDGQAVTIKVFIGAPNDGLVRTNSRFWNASGVDLRVDANGIQLDTESVASILLGGLAFDDPQTLEPGGPAEEGQTFPLYASQEAAQQPSYGVKRRYLLYFTDSVRGLSVGAPVELRGIKIGQVLDVQIEFDPEARVFRIPVLVEIEPDRVHVVGGAQASQLSQVDMIDSLVEKGMRAQLKTGSLLTGQLYVEANFFPDAPPAKVQRDGPYPVFPTVPTPLEQITGSVRALLDKLQTLPLEEIVRDVHSTLKGVDRLVNSQEMIDSLKALEATLVETRRAAQGLSGSLVPAADATLEQAQRSLATAEGALAPDSPLFQELRRTLSELSGAARSLRVMADYLERHPDALIYGKGGKQ